MMDEMHDAPLLVICAKSHGSNPQRQHSKNKSSCAFASLQFSEQKAQDNGKAQ